MIHYALSNALIGLPHVSSTLTSNHYSTEPPIAILATHPSFEFDHHCRKRRQQVGHSRPKSYSRCSDEQGRKLYGAGAILDFKNSVYKLTTFISRTTTSEVLSRLDCFQCQQISRFIVNNILRKCSYITEGRRSLVSTWTLRRL